MLKITYSLTRLTNCLMDDKRLYELTEVTDLSGYNFLVDKDGDTQAKFASIESLAAYVFNKYFQLKAVAVARGDNVINVTGQVTSGYLILGNLRDDEGGGSWKISSQTATSFTVYCSMAGVFTYLIKNA